MIFFCKTASKRLPAILEQRRQLAERYQGLLIEIPGLGLPLEPEWARSNWQSFCVRLPEGCEQRQVMQSLLDNGVAARRGVMCAHRELAYPHASWSCGVDRQKCGCASGSCRRLRHSEEAQDRTLILPLYPQMTFAEQDQVVMALQQAIYS